MKKYQLLVAPLLSVAFLASCGGGNTDSHVVSEQEFNDACSFKNVQYVQLSNTSSGGGSGTFNSVMELSPTVTHSYYESASYYETFVQKKTDGSYEKAIRQDKEGPYNFSVAQASDFYTPQSEYFSVLSQLEHVGLSYKSFTYDSKAGTYSATFTPQAGPETTAVLRFEDKKLISDASSGVDGNISTSIYTYESKTPEYPENPGPGPVDHYFVDAEQFKKALAFEDVEYAHFVSTEDKGESDPILREIAEFSPTVYHVESHNFTKGEDTYNCDIYVTKEDASTYKRYQPITDTTKYNDPYNCLAYTDDAWEVVTSGVTEDEFKTPQNYMDCSSFKYEDFVYNENTHYFYNEDKGVDLQFYDGQLTFLHTETPAVPMKLSMEFDYDEEDIDLPDVTTPISYEVDEDVWAAYKDELSPYSYMSTFFMTEEPVTTKNEIKCVYSEDLIYGFLNQSPISNEGTMERYSFHETSYEEPYDIYYDYFSYNSSPFTRTDYNTKEEWFETSFADPTQAMIKMIFDFDKSTFQFDGTNNLYYADDVSIVIPEEGTVECDLKVAFINNQLVYTDVLSNDGTTIKEHVDVFAKNCFIEVPEFPEPELN